MEAQPQVIIKYSSYTEAQKKAIYKYSAANAEKIAKSKQEYYQRRRSSDEGDKFISYSKDCAKRAYNRLRANPQKWEAHLEKQRQKYNKTKGSKKLVRDLRLLISSQDDDQDESQEEFLE